VSRRLEFILAGFGGQGVMVMGELLAHAALRAGLEVTWMPSYGPEQRGGTANCTVVISSDEIASPVVARPHVGVVMNAPSFDRFEPRVLPHGVLLVNSSLVSSVSHRTDIDVVYLPCTEAAAELGSEKAANMVMLGAVLAATGALALSAAAAELQRFFTGRRAGLVASSEAALRRGFSLVPIDHRHPPYFEQTPASQVEEAERGVPPEAKGGDAGAARQEA
jgi:2-oxoglutarate ferredoxin oxidoreductase subunit gamma